MKIAMIYDAWDIVWWWRIHVENICKQLIKNHNCTIDLFIRAIITDGGIIKKDNEKELNWNLNIIRCGRPKKFFNTLERFFSIYSMILLFLKHNKKQKYNIIHAHTYLPLLVGKLSWILAKVPVVATVHGSQIMDIGDRNFSYYVQKWLLTRIKYDLEICVGKNFLEYSNINNIVNIWNGVNLEEFIWQNHNNDPSIKKLLFVWRLERTKGVDVLIDAIDYIVNSLHKKNILLNIIGYGYDEKTYHNQVKKYRLQKYIKFHWQKKWDELVDFYKQSDFMIVPSRAEWFWIIILEAMASWIPVIATKSWWPEDIIDDWINWFLVKNKDTIALANKISKEIEGNNTNIEKIIKNGLITIKKYYTWEIVGTKIYKEYSSLLNTQTKWK